MESIKCLRLREGLSIEELSKCGVPIPFIKAHEGGGRELLDLERQRIANAFGLEETDLYTKVPAHEDCIDFISQLTKELDFHCYAGTVTGEDVERVRVLLEKIKKVLY